MQACFDDGGIGDASITCVAGYFFRDAALEPFRNEWRGLLANRRFHMVDLVHGHADFADLEESARSRLAQDLIGAIKRHMTLGVVISVETPAFDKYKGELEHEVRKGISSSYSLCAMLCLGRAARWMESADLSGEETVYFFESGNSDQRYANDLLDKIIENPSMDERYRYVSHGFIRKNKLPALDAADLLAWEWTQQCKRIAGVEERPPRASLKSLCEKPHVGDHFGDKNMRIAFAESLLEPFVLPGAGRTARFVRPQVQDDAGAA